jgi:hypothetical protein
MDASELMRLYEAELDAKRRFDEAMEHGTGEEARAAAKAYTDAYWACTGTALSGVEPYSDHT